MQTISLTIPGWKSFQYSEVWKIIQMKDGAIFKVKNTGMHVKNDMELPKGYTKVTISSMAKDIQLNLIMEF